MNANESTSDHPYGTCGSAVHEARGTRVDPR